MKQQVLVVFNKTGKKLPSTTHLKRYQYNIDCPEVKAGDQLLTLEHDNPMQVVSVLGCWSSTPGIRELEVINLNGDDVNGYKTSASYKKSGSSNTNKSNNTNNLKGDNKMGIGRKPMFETIIDKYKLQFMPVRRLGVRLSMDGSVCVPSGSEYVSIDKNNQLISYPEAMTLDVPVYTINKTIDKIEVGDIIADVDGSFTKVVVKDNGTLKVLSYTGTSETKSVAKDFITKQTFVPVVVNMFGGFGGDTSQFNPMMLMMLDNKDFDMKDFMMMQMMSGQSQDQFNPMMLMLLDNKDFDMKDFMMMQMMSGGKNPFQDLMGNVTTTPEPTKVEE